MNWVQGSGFKGSKVQPGTDPSAVSSSALLVLDKIPIYEHEDDPDKDKI
jgi:hypothetical protein